MHTKWECALNNWLAFVDPTEGKNSTTNCDTDSKDAIVLPHITLYNVKDVPHCHWFHEDWSILLLGTTVIREDFLNIWLDDPLRAINDCPDKFVIIAVDRVHQRCWLGRDAMGFQNAYWAREEQGIWIGASLRTVNSTLSKRPELAMEHLSEYLSFRYTHAPRTLYKDRFSLIAGHFSIVGQTKTHEERWYRPQWYEIGQTFPTERESALELDFLLRRGLESDLFSGTKMGVLLSGGLDSSAILYHANELGYQLDSFTVTLESVDADESPFAGRIAHLYNSPNHLLRLESKDLIESIFYTVEQFDLPITTPAAAVHSVLSQFSHQWVDKLFTGDGGDEVFGGRSMPTLARQMRRSKLIHRLPKVSQMGLHRVANKVGKGSWFSNLNQFGLQESIGGSKVFDARQRAELLQDPAYIRPDVRTRILTNFYQEIDSDPINDILYVWQRGWLVEDSLYRIRTIDPNMSFPMLNRELREYFARLPGHYKVRSQGLEFYGKWLLRESMKKRMPKRLLSRPKRTMMAPLDRWLKNDGRSFLAQQITEMTRKEHHIFQPNRLQTLYREHTTGQRNHGLKLWTLILFHLWYRQHISKR
jgi:asparagine synthase (glutamine-hydrolysing)